MIEKIADAIDEAHKIGDTVIFIHKDPPGNVAMDGTLQSKNPRLETVRKITSFPSCKRVVFHKTEGLHAITAEPCKILVIAHVCRTRGTHLLLQDFANPKGISQHGQRR